MKMTRMRVAVLAFLTGIYSASFVLVGLTPTVLVLALPTTIILYCVLSDWGPAWAELAQAQAPFWTAILRRRK